MAVRSQAEATALLVAKSLQLGNSFLISMAIVWVYGLASVGVYTLAMLPSALAALAVTFGLPNALPRSGLSNGAKATLGLLATSLCLLPVGLFAGAYGYAFGRDAGEVTTLIALGTAGGLLGQVNVQQTLYVLQGRQLLSPVAPAIQLAGILAAMFAPTFSIFAFIVLLTRAVSCAVGFLTLDYARLTYQGAKSTLLDSIRFVPLDLIGLLGEQLPVVLLSGALTRAELGMFGLIRQFVTVADTPGWSFVFNHYPALVADVTASAPALARRNERLAWISAFVCLMGALPISVLLYRVPAILPALPIVLLAMPARYLNNFCEQALRASGHVLDCAALAIGKVVLSAFLFTVFSIIGGFWGAVVASALLSALSGLIYRRQLLLRFPGVLRPMRIWRLT